jgi:hypothetical protein
MDFVADWLSLLFYLIERIIQVGSLCSQLEWWNTGIMGSGIMQYWVNGKICVDDKIKNGKYPFINQPSSIPLCHYSIFEASVQAS